MIERKVSFVAFVLLSFIASQNATVITEQFLTNIGYNVKTTTSIELYKNSNIENITEFDVKAFKNFVHLQRLYIYGPYVPHGRFNFSKIPQEIFKGWKNEFIYFKNSTVFKINLIIKVSKSLHFYK